MVGEALFGKVLDNDINVQIEKTKQHFFFYDVRLSHFQFVWLSFLLSPSSPPGFFCALANEATGGQFFSGSRVKQCRTESEVEAEGKKRRNERERKSRRDHPPTPTPVPASPSPSSRLRSPLPRRHYSRSAGQHYFGALMSIQLLNDVESFETNGVLVVK